jgi:hypothetical protein
MSQEVEYKYVTKVVFSIQSCIRFKWGGMGTKTVGPFHQYDICPDIQQIQEKIRQPGKGVNVRKKYIGV